MVLSWTGQSSTQHSCTSAGARTGQDGNVWRGVTEEQDLVSWAPIDSDYIVFRLLLLIWFEGEM